MDTVNNQLQVINEIKRNGFLTTVPNLSTIAKFIRFDCIHANSPPIYHHSRHKLPNANGLPKQGGRRRGGGRRIVR